jgi:predicted TIM-barrel fold metal-dependent hydrolase
MSRRTFLGAGGAMTALAADPPVPVIDIHQHTPYSTRTAEELVRHQQTMGVAKTVLLPAGRAYSLAVGIGGNEAALALVRQYPGQYYFFANELPDIPETRATLEKYLKLGAIGIGEQKFHVVCDGPAMQLVAAVAQEYDVPVLMHFEHGVYNLEYERFPNLLRRFPKVNFIGHAQTFWANIDKGHVQTILYPRTKVTAGGWTDRWLADYPNFYGDLSAGSGLNALQRDEEHAREFLQRHQDKLLYGSDCNDRMGRGGGCSGWQQMEMIRKLAPDPAVRRKIFHDNAARIMRLS